jgi:hypothetical protein
VLVLTWTALGVLTAFSLGVLALHASLNARIDALNARLDRSDAEHRAEIRALGERLERRMDEHEGRPRHTG